MDRHYSNGTATQSKSPLPTEPPEPQPQYRGSWVHPELLDLIESGDITDELFILAVRIDSYVNYKGEGCWASNATLARKCNKSPRRIQFLLKQLMGWRQSKDGTWERTGPRLVRVAEWKIDDDGRAIRILETRWSRINLKDEWDAEDREYPYKTGKPVNGHTDDADDIPPP